MDAVGAGDEGEGSGVEISEGMDAIWVDSISDCDDTVEDYSTGLGIW